jgi:hypothetical protein
MSAEFLISALDEQHIEAVLSRFERNYDAGRAGADHGQVRRQVGTIRQCVGLNDYL